MQIVTIPYPRNTVKKSISLCHKTKRVVCTLEWYGTLISSKDILYCAKILLCKWQLDQQTEMKFYRHFLNDITASKKAIKFQV